MPSKDAISSPVPSRKAARRASSSPAKPLHPLHTDAALPLILSGHTPLCVRKKGSGEEFVFVFGFVFVRARMRVVVCVSSVSQNL